MMTPGRSAEGWYSEHSGVCRRNAGKESKGEEVMKGRLGLDEKRS